MYPIQFCFSSTNRNDISSVLQSCAIFAPMSSRKRDEEEEQDSRTTDRSDGDPKRFRGPAAAAAAATTTTTTTTALQLAVEECDLPAVRFLLDSGTEDIHKNGGIALRMAFMVLSEATFNEFHVFDHARTARAREMVNYLISRGAKLQPGSCTDGLHMPMEDMLLYFPDNQRHRLGLFSLVADMEHLRDEYLIEELFINPNRPLSPL